MTEPHMALYGNTTITGDVETEYDKQWAAKLYDGFWRDLQAINVVDLKRMRGDLFTWRRGSAQMVLKVNPALNNLSIYSVLVTGVEPSLELFRHLLHYNILQRRETLGVFEKADKLFIVLKYTMELELVKGEVLQRHVFAMQEIADQLDTELVSQFGGMLHFTDWDKLDQSGVDNLLANMFG
jgi:T3SS (YopN, CesT) and YbjN peptide-binding chaperone 1